MTKQGLLRVFEANSISECAAPCQLSQTMQCYRLYTLALNAPASQPAAGGWGCRRVDALGRPFDPNVMEAISSLPAGDPGLSALGGPPPPPGSVAAVAQVGYRLHDRVLRPARVVTVTPRARTWRDWSSMASHGQGLLSRTSTG